MVNMNQLTRSKRALVIKMVSEGTSMRTASRVVDASINTVMKLVCEVGEACAAYQDKNLRNLSCTELQMDEVHSFVGCREKNKKNAVNGHPGDVWTWTALCPQTKLIPAWFVGDRSASTAFEFCHDLGKRFSGRVQITSDGLPAYRFAVTSGFGDCDFAQLVKIYGQDADGNEIVTRTEKKVICGNPDIDKISTSLVERSNLTLRMCSRRFTRLTNGFSKKLSNHANALGLHFFTYNFCRKHLTTKTTPALSAGVADKIWSIEDVVDMADEYWHEKRPVQRPRFYKKRTMPKTYPPQPPKLPWYLDPNQKGPENSN
jgi:IS1 family transposase